MHNAQYAGFAVETDDVGIATIQFTTPERLNGFTQRIKRDLIEVLMQLQMDGDVRVVVVTGSGRGFCAGDDTTGRSLPNPNNLPRLAPAIPGGHGNAIGTYEGLRVISQAVNLAVRNLDKPTLVISHNKTLAAQLYSEFRQFFPENAVEYFVSYFDYYQPEAYIPRTDTYIEKDSSVNDEIERLRLSTMGALLTRRDVIVIASVIGIAAPLLSASRKRRPRPAPSVVIRSAAMALGFSAAAVTACSLLHFSDLRWLPAGQRSAPHLSAPGGVFGFAKPIVTVVNSVAGVPAEFQATQVSVHIAITCAFLALAALLLMALTWRRARRADIRQIVREEIRRATGA